MSFRPEYWIDYTDELMGVADEQSSLVALEPEILGTWRVRVQMGGRQIFALQGLDYPAALESVLGAFEVLNRERGISMDT
jgi:hypothetical protein